MYTRLVEHFFVLEDPRCAGKILHRLIDSLVIAVCALKAGKILSYTARRRSRWPIV